MANWCDECGKTIPNVVVDTNVCDECYSLINGEEEESEGEFGCMQTDDAVVDFVEPARWNILKSIFG